MNKNNSASKFISLILRHRHEVIGITLDEHGWASVDELLTGISRTRPLDMAGTVRIDARLEELNSLGERLK
jgi:putative RNA 2'-phosphotransferase